MVFNIGGNKYRLVVRVHHVSHKVFIVGVVIHRGLSKARIATLAEYFGVPADAFL